ncbi:MAG: DUF1553 domain-containing protein [Mariniblastus sp.]
MANSSAQEQLLKKDDPSGFTPHQIEFFENKVRPLLVEHCLQCHGADAKKIRGGLRMSSRAEILLGGDSGPAAVVGKPDDSLMISSIHYQDYEMPPKGKLKDAEIEILTEWVKMGLPDPREPGDVMKPDTIDIEKGKLFWAFKKTQQATPPPTRNDAWPESPIDQFVLSRLESESLAPVTDANREVLIRRAHLALTGLPPTIEQIDRFESDERETKLAFENVVDELLASKHFGERWGRHWLDVARFAESSGGGRSLMFPHAWRFRDYVIDAYNNDKPFDEFIKEQIAGDLLPFDSHAQKTERIVATGLLALGPTNYEQQDKELLRMEVIDEQVDTIGRAFLGLTLGCARCHDHKFDPIPMTDYYAMAGIFGSTRSLVDGNVSKYVERPLATDAELAAEKKYGDRVAALSKKLTAAKKELSGLTGKNETDISDPKKNRLSKNFEGIVLDDRTAKLTGYWKESTSIGLFIDGHYLHDNNGGKDKKLAVFTPKFESGGQYEVRLAYTAGGNRASNVPVTVDHQDGKSTILVNQSQTPPIDGIFISLGTFRFEADNKSSVTISTTDTDGHVIVDAVQFLKKDKSAQPEIQSNQTAENNSTTDTATSDTQQVAKPDGTELKIDAKKANRIAKLNKEIQSLNQRLKQLKKSPPKRLDVAMTVTDTKNPSDGHLHIRGSVRNLGPIIPRGFVTVCCDESPQAKLDLNESGRLQLAEWIASPDHPLTARVYVNRVWRHLFGSGLVSTTDNFGAMGQRPTHPELLDHLAYEFVSNGWSTKKLIRKIMSSHVYRLSTNDNDQARKKDNRNRLLWKSNRRRVDAEVLRDSILFISGDLDLTPGGLTIQKITQYDFDYKFNTSRRSVYVPTFRNSMLGLFEVFDFANPNLVIGDRNTSTLPTQALFLMNNPMIIKQSKKAAKRLLARENLESKSRVEYAYRQSFGRRPTKHEVDDSLAYIESFVAASDSKNAQVEAWSSFCHALFASLEFRYVE